MRFKTKKDFLEKLEAYNYKNTSLQTGIELEVFATDYGSDNRIVIDSVTFKNTRLSKLWFISLEFKKCKFENCQIDDLIAQESIFEEVIFENCQFGKILFTEIDLINCTFLFCPMIRFVFSDCSFFNVEFENCGQLKELRFTGAIYNNVRFTSATISRSRFEPHLIGGAQRHITFEKSGILDTAFYSNDLRRTVFNNCWFERNVFANSTLGARTFSQNNFCSESAFSSIDLHTLNRSAKIDLHTLRDIFGINEPDIKAFSEGFTNDILLQSLFISYSFKDRDFVHSLNQILRSKGVITFLWEKDAPGGRPLRKIMAENVNKFDRILFIASENSIKSKACQYELSQGIKKQDTYWTTVLFPIHIDDFLFSVVKEDVRPKEKRNEYWQNILELRSINSLDFRRFVGSQYDKLDFEEALGSLVKNLKKFK